MLKDREYDEGVRYSRAVQEAIEGGTFSTIKNLVGRKTDKEIDDMLYEAGRYRIIRNYLLGTPWHLVSQTLLSSMLKNKKRRILKIIK